MRALAILLLALSTGCIHNAQSTSITMPMSPQSTDALLALMRSHEVEGVEAAGTDNTVTTTVRATGGSEDAKISVTCKQRSFAFAAFGKNQQLHEMTGVCGVFAGESEQVGFDEAGAEALGGLMELGTCIATSGASCVLSGLIEGGEE